MHTQGLQPRRSAGVLLILQADCFSRVRSSKEGIKLFPVAPNGRDEDVLTGFCFGYVL
jgi:hypothetical protein